MIQDARVLQNEFVPREVQHRDVEVDELSAALNPITRNEPAETALLLGPSGVGKTCIAKYTVERLREATLDIDHQYVNCWQDHSRYKVLYRILEGIGSTNDIHRQSTPHDELLERVRKREGPQAVIILDEVDQLEDDKVLYDLHTIPGISMILIANREEHLFTQLDERIVSRLHSSHRIRFEKYHLEELLDIMEARVRRGLTPDAIDSGQLAEIADAAAGDARIAIGILRSAAREADRQGATRITDAMIRQAIPEARTVVEQANLEKLNEHQRVLYDIIEDHGEINPGELYSQYRERLSDPRTDRTVRNYLRKMSQYNLIQATGEGRGRTYSLPEP